VYCNWEQDGLIFQLSHKIDKKADGLFV